MTRKPVNYSKTIIYRIVCNDITITECYVGHTTDFKSRKYDHKSDCNNEKGKHYNYNIYNVIRDNGGWENWTMVQIEEFNCKNKNEASIRERYWVEYYFSTLNKQVPSRTHKEYMKTYNQKIKNEKLNL